LVRLGADIDQLQCRDLHKDRFELALSPDAGHVNWAMYGTCGDWLYVLEDWGMATWYTGYRSVPAMAPLVGEEFVCLTLNGWDPPSLILHTPGDVQVWEGEFGGDTGRASALDAALHAAGAVFPSVYTGASEEEARRYFEEHFRELPPAVFTAVGNYCGLSIDRATVQAGDLPLAILPSVS
jgi:hypothetical protein